MAPRDFSRGKLLCGFIVLFTLFQAPAFTQGFENNAGMKEYGPYYSNLRRAERDIHLDYRDIHLLRAKRDTGVPSPTPQTATKPPDNSTNAQNNGTKTPSTAAPTTTTVPPTTTTTVQTTTTTVTTTTASPTTTTTNQPKPTGTTPKVDEVTDNHKYYTSQIILDTEKSKHLWIDPYSMENTEAGHKVNKHQILSNSHRTAATVEISFNFLFYGHIVRKITIATGGFLYMSSFLHQWLTATQYIAPLMANFDSTVGEASDIHYVDNGTLFLVQWDKIHLKDESVGPFTFQVAIRKDGLIIFNYKQIPKAVPNLSRAEHPVKVGMADAYYIDTMINSHLRRRTIYEYHRVEIDQAKIKSHTSVVILPYLTCVQQTGCEACFSSNISHFSCMWCSEISRCSDGMDRHRQEWLTSKCSKRGVNNIRFCPNGRGTTKHTTKAATTTTAKTTTTTTTTTVAMVTPKGRPVATTTKRNHEIPVVKPATADGLVCNDENLSTCPSKRGFGGASETVGAIIGIFLILLLICCIIGWIYYAYKNPTTRSGMWLMEHRPSQLKMKMKFWKRNGDSGEKYQVSVEQSSANESVA